MGYKDRIEHPIGLYLDKTMGTIDWASLKGNVDFVVARLGYIVDPGQEVVSCKDANFPGYCQGAYDIDVPFGASLMINPAEYEAMRGLGGIESIGVNEDRHIALMRAALMNTVTNKPTKQFDFYMVHCERWWVYETQHLAAESSGNESMVAAIRPEVILASIRQFLNNLRGAIDNGWLPERPIVLYEARWFVEYHTKLAGGASLYDDNMKIDLYRGAIAQYGAEGWTQLPSTSAYLTWEGLSSVFPSDTAKFDSLSTDPAFWEIGNSFKLTLNPALPPKPTRVMLSMKSRDAFWTWLGFEPTITPPPGGGTVEPPVVVPGTIEAKVDWLIDQWQKHFKPL